MGENLQGSSLSALGKVGGGTGTALCWRDSHRLDDAGQSAIKAAPTPPPQAAEVQLEEAQKPALHTMSP